MKKTNLILFFVSIALLIISCETNKSTDNNTKNSNLKSETIIQKYTNEGFLTHGFISSSNHKVYLKNDNDSIYYKTTTDSNGYFFIKGNINDTIPLKLVSDNYKTNILLYNEAFFIGKNGVLKISKTQEDYNNYANGLNNVITLSPPLQKEIKYRIINNKNLLKLRNKLAKQQYKEIVYLKKYIKQNPKSYSALLAFEELEYRVNLNKEEYQKIWKTFSAENLNTSLGVNLENHFLEKELNAKKELLTNIQKTVKPKANTKPKNIVVDRAEAYYFKGKTIKGSTITLPSVVSKSKLVYIDFWASWCGPCRMQNPVLRSIYKKYHSQGLEIISISEDQDENAWRNAVNIDGLPWIQVLDIDKKIASRYYVQSLPFGVLVDSKGKVIEDFVSAGKLKKLVPKYINEK
jgi:thiol-disulfide isomerase/thioredoxin